MWCWRKKTETLWEERVRDAGLRENEGGTSNSGCSQPFSPSHGCSAGGGGETAPAGRLAEGKAFSSHFGRQSLPLRDRRPFEILCLSSHLGAGQGLHPGGPAGCSSGVCARNPAQTLQPRRDFSGAVGMSPAKPLPHSTLRAHKWEKLVMRRGKHRD